MENWRAALIGVGILLIGFGGYASLDGVWKGLSLVAAGVALVLLGLSLDRGPRPATATSGGGSAGIEAGEDLGERSEVGVGTTAPLAAVSVDEAEETLQLERPTPLVEPDTRTAGEPEPQVIEPEPVAEASEPQPVAGGPEPRDVQVAVEEPEAVEEPAAAVEQVAAGGSEIEPEAEAGDGTDHVHDQPMLGHSELVSHIRDYHPSVPFDGSTIQLRLLHERAHA